jgi:hypothetical protein
MVVTPETPWKVPLKMARVEPLNAPEAPSWENWKAAPEATYLALMVSSAAARKAVAPVMSTVTSAKADVVSERARRPVMDFNFILLVYLAVDIFGIYL